MISCSTLEKYPNRRPAKPPIIPPSMWTDIEVFIAPLLSECLEILEVCHIYHLLCLRIAVLLVGTNNHDHSAPEVASGILAVVEAIQQRQEKCHVIVVELPPRGKLPNKLRDKLQVVNRTVSDKLGK